MENINYTRNRRREIENETILGAEKAWARNQSNKGKQQLRNKEKMVGNTRRLCLTDNCTKRGVIMKQKIRKL